MVFKITNFYTEEAAEIFCCCLPNDVQVVKESKKFLIIDIGNRDIESVLRLTRADANYRFDFNLSELEYAEVHKKGAFA